MMKNIVLVSFFVLLSAILIYTFFFATGGRVDLQYPVEKAAVCKEGLTQHCMVGNCSGLSECRNASVTVNGQATAVDGLQVGDGLRAWLKGIMHRGGLRQGLQGVR